MKITFKAGSTLVTLRVPGPQGLIDPEPPVSEFVIKMMSPSFGMAMYRDLVNYQTEKPGFFAEQMALGHSDYELPFAASSPSTGRLEVRNDAHIIAALVKLGATEIPVQVHETDAPRVG